MPTPEHHFSHRSPQIRAAVLGANDGIISIAGVMMAIVAAGADLKQTSLTVLSALIAGALSMGVGEYISVSSQLDTEKADIEREKLAHKNNPQTELNELIEIYEEKGLSHELAREVATELSKKNAVELHLKEELGLEPDNLSGPISAAIISFLAFSLGGGLPSLLLVIFPLSKIASQYKSGELAPSVN